MDKKLERRAKALGCKVETRMANSGLPTFAIAVYTNEGFVDREYIIKNVPIRDVKTVLHTAMQLHRMYARTSAYKPVEELLREAASQENNGIERCHKGRFAPALPWETTPGLLSLQMLPGRAADGPANYSIQDHIKKSLV